MTLLPSKPMTFAEMMDFHQRNYEFETAELSDRLVRVYKNYGSINVGQVSKLAGKYGFPFVYRILCDMTGEDQQGLRFRVFMTQLLGEG